MDKVLSSNNKSLLIDVLSSTNGSSTDVFDYKYTQNIPNGVKYRTYVSPNTVCNNIYGDEIFFNIPKVGLLSKMFIECILTSTMDLTNTEDNLANNVFEYIDLLTIDGHKTIQKLDQYYLKMRLDQSNSELTSIFDTITNPNQTFNNNTVKCYIPLFYFFSDSPDKFINTRFTEELCIHAKVNETSTVMGVPDELTSVPTFRLICDFIIMNEFNENVPRNMLTYDFIRFKDVAITTGSTSVVVYVESCKNIFSTSMLLINNSQESTMINSFTIEVDSVILWDSDSRLSLLDCGWFDHANFKNEFSSLKAGNSMTTHYNSIFKNRNVNTLSVNTSHLPVQKYTINFDSIGAGFSLIMFSEYWNLLEITQNGKIQIS